MRNLVLSVIAVAVVLASVASAAAQSHYRGNWPGGDNSYTRSTENPNRNFAPDGL